MNKPLNKRKYLLIGSLATQQSGNIKNKLSIIKSSKQTLISSTNTDLTIFLQRYNQNNLPNLENIIQVFNNRIVIESISARRGRTGLEVTWRRRR